MRCRGMRRLDRGADMMKLAAFLFLTCINDSDALSLKPPQPVPSPPTITLPEPNNKSQPKATKTAVILNTNARSVTSDIEPMAVEIFGADNVFVTTSELEARQAADKIAKNLDNFDVVVPVGGDGTLASMINYLCQSIGGDAEEALGKLPLIGYIPMGTGNGVGSVVGCRLTKGIWAGGRRKRRRRLSETFKQLASIAKKDNSYYETVDMPMVQITVNDENNDVSGDLCFFAGVGFDSLMLNDFKAIKRWSQKTGILKELLGSVTGYCVALVAKTLPKCVARGEHKINIELKSNDPDCLWVDHRRGDMVLPCSKSVLYHGTTGILAAATSPFYGGGMRLFPFARLTKDKMHLRVGRIHPLDGFLNIPRIFSGSYRDRSDAKFGCLDFIGDDFEVKVEPCQALSGNQFPGFPLQHSGESVGDVERFRLRVVPKPVRFVSFLAPRIEEDLN